MNASDCFFMLLCCITRINLCAFSHLFFLCLFEQTFPMKNEWFSRITYYDERCFIQSPPSTLKKPTIFFLDVSTFSSSNIFTFFSYAITTQFILSIIVSTIVNGPLDHELHIYHMYFPDFVHRNADFRMRNQQNSNDSLIFQRYSLQRTHSLCGIDKEHSPLSNKTKFNWYSTECQNRAEKTHIIFTQLQIQKWAKPFAILSVKNEDMWSTWKYLLKFKQRSRKKAATENGSTIQFVSLKC